MKLDYIRPVGLNPRDLPIVRLYGFSTQEVVDLIRMFTDLADGKLRNAILQEQHFIQPIGGISVELKVGQEDEGMQQIGKDLRFECQLTTESWREAAFLAEPFLGETKPHSYQWLVDPREMSIEFLLSVDGCW